MNAKKIIFLLICFAAISFAQNENSITLKDGLILKSLSASRGSIFSADPIELKIIRGKWETPEEGDSVSSGTATSKWTKISVNQDGWFVTDKVRSGYLSIIYDSPKKQKMLLTQFGNSFVYVNGVLHYGNRYGSKEKYEAWEPRFDYSIIPVEMKKGKNEFIFSYNGTLKAKLTECGDAIVLNTNDSTLPDIIEGETYIGLGGTIVINATDRPLADASIVCISDNGCKAVRNISYPIQPGSMQKVPFAISIDQAKQKGSAEIKLQVVDNKENKILAETKITLRVVGKSENHKVTFLSGIDGSVQYYSVNPAKNEDGKPKALFLSVHGAGVEAINQSGSYYAKTWGNVVSPTNRRPYGFDWEDWGRIDAIEVYNNAIKTLNIDPNRIYLTGHSMGGHGTWHIGALYPDKFAAIAPSAGWVSFKSYLFRGVNNNPTPIENMLMRATSPSDTYGLSENYKQEGIYIIHGEKDDNVPVSESLSMVENLKKFHKDFVFYEQPGAGHWWDNSDEDGADCVDWAPMFDFLSHHALPQKDMVREISFITPNPEISSSDYWITVISQIEQLKFSKVNFHFDPGKNRFIGKTENVFQFSIDCSIADLKRQITLDIDGQKLTADSSNLVNKQLLFENTNGKWNVTGKINYANKSPLRYGTFKSAINHNVIFIYGTEGNKEENEWSFNKARYDAEQFWYVGNGSIAVISDKQFSKNDYKGRNFILYGNSETNSAWSKLLADSPVQVEEGKVTIGDKVFKGKDYACIFVRPVAGSDVNSVGVISGSGILGMRLNDRRPYMQPGYEFPDMVLYNSDILSKGIDGVIAAGLFGLDWSVNKGEIVYKNQQ